MKVIVDLCVVPITKDQTLDDKVASVQALL